MKKIIAILLVILMVAGLCGCNMTVTNPDEVVDGFLKAVQDKDEDTLILYAENSDVNTLLYSVGDEEQIARMYENVAKNLTWNIVSVTKNEDETTAAVVVEVTNSDFSKVLKKYQKKATEYMGKAIYEEDITKTALNRECLDIYVSQIQAAAEDADNLVTQAVTVNLTKNDSYGWDMELTDELVKAAIGGLEFPN